MLYVKFCKFHYGANEDFKKKVSPFTMFTVSYLSNMLKNRIESANSETCSFQANLFFT